jgi:ankyrin repeat protein
MRSLRFGIGCLALLALIAVGARWALSDGPQHKDRPPKDEVSALIDDLQKIAEGDVGYMPTRSGGGFLPLGKSETGAMMLGQKRPASSSTMRELVTRGAAAVPQLIAHLDDKRPTKITIEHKFAMGGMFFEDEYDYNSRTIKQPPKRVNRDEALQKDQTNKHTVTVGDLCFVALGQIVNRHFSAVRYQPTACIMINSPTKSEALRTTIKKEWENLTRAQHKESLIRDFLEPDYEERRIGACLRLGFYYPEALEPLVLKQLAAGRYDVFEVEALIRKKLYPTKDPKERKKLFDDFVGKRGEPAHQGILLYLFEDLDTQYAARECLVELFGYTKQVKSKDRPHVLPVENCQQARFIDALALFPSAKTDQAVREVLRSTKDDYLASSCVRYLVGRGADDDIQQYVDKCWKGADERRRQQLERMRDRLGWTPLHVAAEMGERDKIDELVRKGADVNARATNGQTPLHVAANGQFGAIRALLDRKADPNIKDRQGRTPVQLGIGYDDAVKILLAGGAEPSDILVASFAGRADLVEGFLVRDKALIGAKTLGGETPLHFAARLGHLKVAEVLLAHGARVNAPEGESKLTPLHRAASYNHVKMVALLLGHNADRRAKSWDGKTPLDFAVEQKNEEIIRLLEGK